MKKSRPKGVPPGTYSIMCREKHPDLWRSIFGVHLICAVCRPPVSEDVVRERLTRAELLEREPGAVIYG